MKSKIAVIGEDTHGVSDTLTADRRVEVVRVAGHPWCEAAGADVAVVWDGVDVWEAASGLARRAPAAVVLIATTALEEDVERARCASLLPRPRVFGLQPQDVAAAVDAVLYDAHLPVTVAAYCRGELGIENRVATVPARVGAGGLRFIGTT